MECGPLPYRNIRIRHSSGFFSLFLRGTLLILIPAGMVCILHSEIMQGIVARDVSRECKNTHRNENVTVR
jgi:hypothetical protein